MKKFLLGLILLSAIPAYAFEDCLITTNGKLTDISIEHNDIVDVYPVVTIMNEKNTLFVHPLKTGETRVCVLKNGKEKVMFNIKITPDKTEIEDVKGFDILKLDPPPMQDDEELDPPPMLREIGKKEG